MNYKAVDASKLLKQLDKLSKIDISKALELACITIENQARENAPVETGELRRSIIHEVEGNVGYVGTTVVSSDGKPYGIYVEIGTGLYSSEGTGRTYDLPWSYQDEKGEWHSTSGQRPHPYLAPAFHQKEKEATRRFTKQLEKDIKELK